MGRKLNLSMNENMIQYQAAPTTGTYQATASSGEKAMDPKTTINRRYDLLNSLIADRNSILNECKTLTEQTDCKTQTGVQWEKKGLTDDDE